ncbi:MAG: FtsX-like permease family protein [Nitrososphaeria archaeon]|nr:FtsX-like permease family protein [Nitrososphaeria archaeon]NIN52685.1 FtsX-like permease family protein [Nitrososphaeria archaeon]NIQ33160.1 FtsX-like permease family protein [Nitrososphaeria archaeon]
MGFTTIAIRNIPKRKLRNALTVLSIAIGVAMLIGVNIATETTFAELRNFVLTISGNTDIMVTSSSRVPFEEVKSNYAMRGVRDAEATGVLALQGFIKYGADRKGVSILGIDQQKNFEYTSHRFDGSARLGGSRVTISNAIHEELDVDVGGSVVVEMFPEKRHVFQVVGIYHPKVDTQNYQIYVDLGYMQQLYGFTGRISYIAVSVDEMSRTGEIKQRIEQNLGDSFRVNAIKEESIESWESNLEGWRQGLSIVSMLSLFVAFGLVVNTMYMNVGERTYEVGVLRALGAPRRGIFWMFFCEAILLAGMGIAIGIPTGIGMANLLHRLIEGLFGGFGVVFGSVGLVLKPEIYFMGVTAGFIASIVGGFIPSYSATRIGVIQALKPSMRSPGKRATSLKLFVIGAALFSTGTYIVSVGIEGYFLDVAMITVGLVILVGAAIRVASPGIDVLLSPFMAVGKLLSRNLGRNLKRSALTYATIGITLSFVVMIGGIQVSINNSVITSVKEYLPAHILVFGSTPISTTFSRDLETIDPGKIESVTYLRFTMTKTKSGDHDLGIIGTDPLSFPKIFKDLEFEGGSPDRIYSLLNMYQSAILVEPLADTLGVSVGDRIQVYAGSETTSLNVVGVAKGMGLSFMSMGGGFQMSQAAFVSYTTAKQFFPQDEREIADMFMIRLRDERDIGYMENKIVEMYDNKYDLQTLTLNQVLNEINDMMERSFMVFNVVLYMAILSATAGIAATMVMNVSERQREIGILRAEGMRRIEIFTLIVGEALFLGFLGFVVGVPTGIVILQGVLRMIATLNPGLTLNFLISFERILLAFGLAMFSSFLGVLYPSIRALKVKPVEALKYRG